MSDRERSGHRPGSDGNSSQASAHPLAFLPNLFGRRTSHKAPHGDARKASASSSVTRTSVDDVNPLASPPAGTAQLPTIPPSPNAQPFHLESALSLMEPGATKNTAELVEIVKAMSVHLANVLLDHSPGDVSSPLEELGISSAHLRLLYARAMELSDPKSDYALRTAAIRLLAVLLGAAPPPDSVLDPNPNQLPQSVTRRSLYALITAPSGGTPSAASTNQVFVEAAALKALTREGTQVDGMDGIIGWMLRAIAHLKSEWVTWCGVQDEAYADTDGRDTPFGPIKSASPAASASAVIDLTAAIVQHHTAVFSPADLTHIVRPLVDFLWHGIIAASGAPPSAGSGSNSAHSTINRGSIHSASHTAHNSPAPSRRDTRDTRRATSLSVGRVEPFPSMTRMADKSPSRAAAMRQVKWARPFKSLCSFVHMLFETTTINDDLFDEVFELMCFAFGQDEADAMRETADSSPGALDLVRTMLGIKSGRRGELALHHALEGKLAVSKIEGRKSLDIERKVTRGAVIIARLCIQDREFAAQASSLNLSFPTLAASLVGAQSTSRFPGTPEARAADWARWAPVDSEILSFLDSHLSTLEVGNDEAKDTDDAWTEGEAASEVLDGMRPLIASLSSQEAPRTLLKTDGDSIVAAFSSITRRLPVAIGRLNSRLHTSRSDQSPQQSSPSFYHPKYVELLLDLGNHLDEETASVVVDYYQRECLCLPFTTGWLKNIWRLLEAFGLSYDLPVARVRVSHLLYRDIYGYVDDLPQFRSQLVEQVLVPYLSKWLPDETDEELLTEALGVLVRAAVSETQEADDERRRARALMAQAEVEAEDAAAHPDKDMLAAVTGGSFGAIRGLLTKLAVSSPCREAVATIGSAVSMQSLTSPTSPTSPPEGLAREGRTARDRNREPTALRSLMRTLSPSREPASPPPNMSMLLSPEETSAPPSPGRQQHLTCRSLHAVKAMIAIFTRLAFSTSYAGKGHRPLRTPASARCIEVYRDLLHLCYSINDKGAIPRVPARCPRARLIILQWAMRFRADRKHRILFRDDINRFVMPFAQTLYRTKESEEQIRQQIEAEEARKRARAQTRRDVQEQARGGEEERGRATRAGDSTARSRSRSRLPTVGSSMLRTSADTQSYNPIWCLPETLSFESPPDNHPSEGLLTYDPHHPSLRVKNAPLVEGVWLPVSDYVRVLNGILRWEHDWELVSYVLCFLPQQLGNKHFFHGVRATREVRGLLRVLCDGILDSENRWEKRYNVPSFIKRFHINSVAYQAISVLIAYRSVFDRGESDRLIQSLVFGLEGHALLARPCLQALTISIYELESYVAKHLHGILQKMQQILSIPAVAVHILEFLVALGNSPLYRNFTEDQYRLVFAVAIGYIAEHNARTDTAESFTSNRDAFTLSQHVIGIAYHSVYLWFLAMKVTQRPRHVSYLVRGLLHAKSQRGAIDERTEVCFDWLARYAYGNADPKPATSFLSEVVMRPHSSTEQGQPKSVSWLLGGAIVTVTSHQRTGWATISTTRPTGQTTVVCKLENVPLLGLGEDDADMTSLPAVLMANREQHRDVNDQKSLNLAKEDAAKDDKDVEERKASGDSAASKETMESKPSEDAAANAIVNVKPSTAHDDKKEYVWTGATPSQRRKDVVIEPSFLALQLLSSYPNATPKVPRGQLIPKGDRFDRALRGIDQAAVINTAKIAVLYVGPGQRTENEILANVDGSPLYLDFLAGLGRVIRLKGQVDVFTGGMDRENDTDGQYAYAWWDDLAQTIFHAPTLMPNTDDKTYRAKKRLVGNDYVKIVYNESGNDFAFDTIKTAFNFVNIIISPYATRDMTDVGSLVTAEDSTMPLSPLGGSALSAVDEWGGDSDDFFKVTLQRVEGIPDFSPIGEYKLVSRKNLPTLVRQIAQYANSMAMRFQYVQAAPDAASAEFITIWRTRFRAIQRLRDMLPKSMDDEDEKATEEMLRDFTRTFSPMGIGD